MERPAAFPGKCAVCGSVNKPVIDFGSSIDFTDPSINGYGVVYLCVDCVVEAAMQTGLVVPISVFDTAVHQAENVIAAQAPVLDAVKEYNEQQRTLSHYFSDRIANLLVDGGLVSEGSDENQLELGVGNSGTDSSDESNSPAGNGSAKRSAKQKSGTASDKGTSSVSSSSGSESSFTDFGV
jgi:hypothetical protein